MVLILAMGRAKGIFALSKLGNSCDRFAAQEGSGVGAPDRKQFEAAAETVLTCWNGLGWDWVPKACGDHRTCFAQSARDSQTSPLG